MIYLIIDLNYYKNLSVKENINFKSEKIDFLSMMLETEAKSGKYTNLAYLLSDQSEIVVKVAEYDSEMNFKIKKSFKGSLVNVLKNVEEQVERLLLR